MFCSTTRIGDVLLVREANKKVAHLSDDHRRETFGRLVHDEKAGIAKKRPSDRQHLLLAARKLAAAVATPERRPTARDIAGEIDAIGGEFNAFTGKEYHRLLRQVRHRAPRRRARRARRHAPQLALRRRGDRAREGRDHRGDEHVLRHAARLHRRRLRRALVYGDQPLGWDIIGRKETVRAATRETFISYLDRWYTADAHGGRRRAAQSATGSHETLAGAARRPSGRATTARRRR